jgi:hypothetical protein
MSVSYTELVDAMISAEAEGVSIDSAVLTTESIETFLTDEYDEEVQKNQEAAIGEEWQILIESGDDDYLLLEDGSKMSI